ncbi:Protein of unknown function [Propionibacterium freudenreichii]|nr:Protein of unknown function [Propionibacterium freudenreichii]
MRSADKTMRWEIAR